jgi:hypothetical protein
MTFSATNTPLSPERICATRHVGLGRESHTEIGEDTFPEKEAKVALKTGARAGRKLGGANPSGTVTCRLGAAFTVHGHALALIAGFSR